MEDNTNPTLGSTEQTEPVEQTTATVITEEAIEAYKQQLRGEQNLALSIVACVATCLIGAVVWCLVSYSTGYQIGYMAIGIGFLVGYANRYLGKGIDPIYGVLGGAFALISCVLGNYFTIIAFAANETNISFFNMLGMVGPDLAFTALSEAFSPIDLLFYGLAVYEGYKFSFRQVTEEEVMAAATAQV